LKKNNYFPALDATRFIAFMAVFLTHCFLLNDSVINNEPITQKVIHFLNKGLLGLDYFFVLSGFLITYIMLQEYKQNVKLNFIAFFIRRCLRIWPLYFAFVIAGFLLQYFNFTHEPLPPIIHFLSFTLNYYIVFNGYDFLFFLVILWSISVEEQFYLIVGCTFKLLSKTNILKNGIFAIGCALIIGSIVFRFMYQHSQLNLYFNSLSVMGNFGVGILLAHTTFYNTKWIIFIQKLKYKWVLIFNLLFLICIVFYTQIFSNGIVLVLERLIFAIFFAFIIALQCFNNRTLFPLKDAALFQYFGKISLGMYFFHGIIITIFSVGIKSYQIELSSLERYLLIPTLMLTCTILLAMASYKWFEKPILALKSKFYS
jgi:peptidoglycan/LPS O-acetylase OafA/YrhL